MGAQVMDLLFVHLATNPDIYLVDRTELQNTLQETELNLSGMVAPGQAVQVGQLTGARILVTGSVMEVADKIYIVAKIIGTETTRVQAASVKGGPNDDIDDLAEKLAEQIAKTIVEKGDMLVAKTQTRADLVKKLKETLGDAERPTLFIQIPEQHVGQTVPDPAAQTEITLLAREAGFEVVDPEGGRKRDADVLITGEGLSEFATRRGNLVSVKARLEVKAADAESGKIIAVDRQVAVVVDLTEQLGGKAALQRAAEQVAMRLLPLLVKGE
jgi:hypothetical protein